MSSLIELINAELPQFQCGRCETPGCRPYAEEIINGSPHNRCVPGGQETADKISKILNANKLLLDHDYGPEIKPQVAYIVEEDCIGCTKCIDACPVDAINGAANLMHNVINDLCTGCELCIDPCPVDCIELIEASEEQSLKIRKDSDHFFQLKNELLQRKNKKTKLNKSISENLDLAKSINKKLSNRNVDKEKSIKKLQTEMLNYQKTEKYINPSDIENLKKQL
ncbi:RnfABCDGE type electron transport complex subunit B [Gammaproteobacteria bacterium]|nr:RnfABCDGE type electron transport complex subunit B [Gammaproteobacteria bacterium]